MDFVWQFISSLIPIVLFFRVESQNHWFTYDEKMQVESVAQAVSNLAIAFGDSDGDEIGMMSRPFGVAILYAG